MPICPRCGKPLSTQQALDYHLTKQKKCKPQFQCNNCGQIFFTSTELKIHQAECNLHLPKLARIIRNEPICYFIKDKSSTSIVILSKSFIVLHSDSGDKVGSCYFDDFLSNHIINLKLAITENTERFLTHKKENGGRIWLSAFSHGDKYIISERKYVHPYRLHGFLTPPW